MHTQTNDLCAPQANVAAVLDGVSPERVKIESVGAASVVVAFYIEDALAGGTLSSEDATAQLMVMDASTLEATFPDLVGLDRAPVRNPHEL